MKENHSEHYSYSNPKIVNQPGNITSMYAIVPEWGKLILEVNLFVNKRELALMPVFI